MRTDEAAAKDDMSAYLEYLKRFELDKKKRYKKLSKGMKTKAQFAFALSHDAKLFLLADYEYIKKSEVKIL